MKVVACAQLLAGTSEAVIGGKLQKDSLSYKLRACGQKVGVCLLQTHFFFPITLDSASFQCEKQLKQE